MIKAKARSDHGDVLILGLSFENIKRLVEKGQPIHIDRKEIDIPFDIMIFAGETEESMAKSLEPHFAPFMETNIIPYDRDHLSTPDVRPRWTLPELEAFKGELMSRYLTDPIFKKAADAIGSLQFDLVDLQARLNQQSKS